MKLIFATDHRFIPIENQVYSETQFPSSLWKRYLELKSDQTLTIVCRKGSTPPYKTIKDIELSSTSYVDFDFFPNLSGVLSQFLHRRKVSQQMKKVVSEADGVIARLPSELGLLAISCASSLQKPWAVEVAGCPWDGLWNYGSWQGKLYAPIKAFRMHRAVSKAPFALYVTQHFLQKRYPPSPEGIVEACSNVEIPEPSEEVLSQRIKKIEEHKGKVTFGLIGSLYNRVKGIQTVLSALKFLRNTNKLSNYQFRILGGGDSKSWLLEAKKHGVEDLVYFDGTLPAGEAVFQWLDQIDIYLQPSLKEGLPRALIEAMSRGCPAIASNIAGIPELLEAECLIEPGNFKELATMMLLAANNTDWCRKHAYKNWEKSREYSQDKLRIRRRKFWYSFAEYIQKK